MNGQLRSYWEGAGLGNSGSSPGEKQQSGTGWRQDRGDEDTAGMSARLRENVGEGAAWVECLRGSWESESRSVVSDSLRPRGLYSLWNFPGQNTGVGSLSLLQGNFLTQGSNPGLLHCRRILCQLSHKGSPRILECVAYLFSSGCS